MGDDVLPFRIDVPDAELDDLRRRLAQTRWPREETVSDWSQGVPLEALRGLCDYWREGYDWRRCEALLNGSGQYRTAFDGLGIHFLHIRSPHADALPLLLMHGWPGSILEFRHVFRPLTEPEDFGGSKEDAFHLVIPSLPGYAFSDASSSVGWGVERIAATWIALMDRLGYARFVAQGGDWGSMIASAIAMAAPPSCIGIHVNMPIARAREEGDRTPAEDRAIADLRRHEMEGAGYSAIQSTRPQTLGYGLADSPVAQAAWIYEKFHAWTDNDGMPESAISRDDMLDTIMLYWLGNAGASSARLYWEAAGKFRPKAVDLPTSISIFPKEISRPSRRWAEHRYRNIIYWNELDRGGHFAAAEQPALFVGELRACFRKLR